MYLAHDAEAVEDVGEWYRQFEYQAERERGLDCREDLFNPLVFRFDLNRRPTAVIIASTQRHSAGDAPGLSKAEIARRIAVVKAAPGKDDLVRSLTIAADQFIVARDRNKKCHRRLSLVQQLGKGHNGRASRADVSDGPL
jgi:hypothetical protein